MRNRGEDRRLLRKQIIKAASSLYRQRGIKAVTMDDVAHALGISKRTLYEVFREKEELVVDCMLLNHKEFVNAIEKFQKQSKNVLEATLNTLQYVMKQNVETSVHFLEDATIYPRVNDLIQKDRIHKHEAFLNYFSVGVQQGLFMANLNYEIVVNMLVENNTLKQFTLNEVIETILMTFLRGIVTDKGRKILGTFPKEFHKK